MENCKAKLPVASLAAVVYLFCQVLDLRQTNKPLNIAAMSSLASVLAIRFIYTDEIHNLVQSFSLREKILETLDENQGVSYTDLATRGLDYGNTADKIQRANQILIHFRNSIPMNTINTIMSDLNLLLEMLPATHPMRFAALSTLADGLYARFLYSGDIHNLDDAISYEQDAVKCGSDLEYHNARIFILSAARFDKTKHVPDLRRAISSYRKMDIPEGSAVGWGRDLWTFANALHLQFDQSNDLNHLNAAISFYRQAITSLKTDPSSEGYFNALVTLAAALYTRFMSEAQQHDLHESISLSKQAIALQSPSHLDRFVALNNLANALWTRFTQDSQHLDLFDAIAISRQVLKLRPPSHPDRALPLTVLANALATRFQQGLGQGQTADIDEAISLHRQALNIRAAPHPLRSKSLSNLASALLVRFEHVDGQIDLDESISLSRQALELRPHPHPLRSSSLNNLASALMNKFHYELQQIHLDEAISLFRESVMLRPAPHPSRSKSLHNLGSALRSRFTERGQKGDLDESISLYQQALGLEPPPHSLRSTTLDSLAVALEARFHRDSDATDLDDAISLHEQALKLKPLPHPRRAISLNNLANAMWARFQRGHMGDLDTVVALYRQACELHTSHHPDRYSTLANLAQALAAKFERDGHRIDLDEAISSTNENLELQPLSHSSRSASLFLLGNLFVLAHSLDGETSKYLEQAMASYRAATRCLSQSASLCLLISKGWVFQAQKHHHISAIDAYEAALQALPRVVALSFDIQSRQEALDSENDGLARRAARCAILAGDLEKAIEFLEAGRSVFWSQVLSLRSPFRQLHDIEPKLANKLKGIAEDLELGSHRNTLSDMSDNLKKIILDRETSRLNRRNEEWVKSIEEARNVVGFEDFLRPLRISSLRSAASDCTVAFALANDECSDCLIMTATSIDHIQLPFLHNSVLFYLVNLVQVAISQLPFTRSLVDQASDKVIEFLGEKRGSRFHAGGLKSSDDIFKAVLGVLWDELVKPVIDLLNIKKSKETPKHMLQWCATGLFSFLPIHAAGCYDDKLAAECASDYFISSYTPTIGALLAHPPVSPAQKLKVMVVIQSSELASVKKELAKIRNHVPNDALIEFGIPGRPAEVETVASQLSDASIVHFACHGIQDRSKPLDSGLKLDGGFLRVSRIMKERLQNGSLAFLCACETTRGHVKLPDEAMSVGASLLFSGFRRVIGTMWEIKDKDGPTIADAFYEELFQRADEKPTLEPDTTKSARALHVATQKLRSQNVSFSRWVPFIHMGK
ncbi:hypothetical protein GALMADRAFT_237749 [Galerina marginata CBS 339.88]|uniref:CHAT domain-containing protein n=1 Tax=Galerina marginata (strain CBS 339.88) TaxID=685588 RepID=A0A067TU32_GALM3|nr:hypothetical protein GALMADRAFT_237749 [Galerina marginata CBS 339.88]